MSKFKVGDRVRANIRAGFSRGSTGVVTYVPFGPYDYGVILDGASSSVGYQEAELDPVIEPATSPVRERTIKEIVPGVYGRVKVELRTNGVELTMSPHFYCDSNPSELTAAIATLTTVRDALDEVAPQKTAGAPVWGR